ncbi:MAG: hypothetical protein HQK49_00130 [Oligoflexia bacterium]|nr:hypothetical protein [Oligoflexia bacterium]
MLMLVQKKMIYFILLSFCIFSLSTINNISLADSCVSDCVSAFTSSQSNCTSDFDFCSQQGRSTEYDLMNCRSIYSDCKSSAESSLSSCISNCSSGNNNNGSGNDNNGDSFRNINDNSFPGIDGHNNGSYE